MAWYIVNEDFKLKCKEDTGATITVTNKTLSDVIEVPKGKKAVLEIYYSITTSDGYTGAGVITGNSNKAYTKSRKVILENAEQMITVTNQQGATKIVTIAFETAGQNKVSGL